MLDSGEELAESSFDNLVRLLEHALGLRGLVSPDSREAYPHEEAQAGTLWGLRTPAPATLISPAHILPCESRVLESGCLQSQTFPL